MLDLGSNLRKRAVFGRARGFQFGGDFGQGFEKRGNEAALEGVIDVLRQAAGRLQRGDVTETRGDDADDVARKVHQRAARVDRWYWSADLGMARVIFGTSQAADLALGELR